MATASFIIPYPNKTEWSVGYFYGFIREIHATVSVAHKTLLIINIYFKVKELKNISSRRDKNTDKQIKPMIVPKIPKKLISPIFWKNKDFLRL